MDAFRDIPLPLFLITVAIPLGMVVMALIVGWTTRRTAEDGDDAAKASPATDSMQAAITVALVPLLFALLLLWARFG